MEQRRSAAPELQQLSPHAPRQPPGFMVAEEERRWCDHYLRHENLWLTARVQELERQLRRRTLMLGSGVILMIATAAGSVFFPFVRSRPHVETVAAIPAGAPRLPAPPVGMVAQPPTWAVPAAKEATPMAVPAPAVEPLVARPNGTDVPRAEGPVLAPPGRERDAAVPAVAPARLAGGPMPSATGIQMSPPPPSVPTEGLAEAVERGSTLRAVLSKLRQRMQVHQHAGGAQETADPLSRLGAAEQPAEKLRVRHGPPPGLIAPSHR